MIIREDRLGGQSVPDIGETELHEITELSVHEIKPGQTVISDSLTLRRGTHIVFCGIPGHYGLGQYRRLTVR